MVTNMFPEDSWNNKIILKTNWNFNQKLDINEWKQLTKGMESLAEEISKKAEENKALGSRGGNISNLRYADDTTLMAESEKELKSPLMKVKEGSEKVDLKFNIQKTKIMASGPITSWEIDGETVETMSDFILGGSKITEMVTTSIK